MEKEFGKYSLKDLIELVSYIKQLPVVSEETLSAIREKPEDFFGQLNVPFYWSLLYSRPYVELISFLVVGSGQKEWLSEIAGSPDQQRAVLDSIKAEIESMRSNELIELPKDFKPEAYFSALIAFHYTIESIWLYGYPMNDLVVKAANGSNKALFDAVRLDKSAVACPEIASRISLATMTEDEDFFEDLKRALNGKPGRRQRFFGPLRYVLTLLSEDGVLDSMSEKQRCNLLHDKLQLYSTKSTDPQKSLSRFIQRWKKGGDIYS